MFDFSLKELSAPITKLIETVSAGIGILFEPKRITRKAKADAKSIKIIAQAKVEALAIQDESLKTYYLALEKEKLMREFQQKMNRDNVILLAAKELDGKNVNDQKVDGDWATQFFNYAENISNEEMQLLWAKLLAGEVQKPGSFSKRSLNTLIYMSEEEARVFCTVAMHSIENEAGTILFPRSAIQYLSDNDPDFNTRKYSRILESLNLISIYNFPVDVSFKPKTGKDYIWISNYNYGIQVKSLGNSKIEEIVLDGQMFTHIGKELAQLIKQEGNMNNCLRSISAYILRRKSSKNPTALFQIEFGELAKDVKEEFLFQNSETISSFDGVN